MLGTGSHDPVIRHQWKGESSFENALPPISRKYPTVRTYLSFRPQNHGHSRQQLWEVIDSRPFRLSNFFHRVTMQLVVVLLAANRRWLGYLDGWNFNWHRRCYYLFFFGHFACLTVRSSERPRWASNWNTMVLKLWILKVDFSLENELLWERGEKDRG